MVSLRRRRLMGFTVGAAPDLPDNLHLPEDALPRTEPVAANPAPTGNEAPPAVNRNPPDQAAPHGPNPATTVITIPMDEFDETKLVIDLNIPADAPPSIEPASINQAPSVNEQQPTSEVSNALSGVGASNISAFSPLYGPRNAFQLPNLIRRPRSSKTLAMAASKFVSDAFPEAAGLAEGDSSTKDPDYEPNASRSGLTRKKKKQSSSERKGRKPPRRKHIDGDEHCAMKGKFRKAIELRGILNPNKKLPIFMTELLSCLEEKPIQVYQRRKSRNSEMLTGDMIYDFYTKKSSEAASQVDESEPLAKNSDLEVDQGAAEASSAFSSSPNDVKYSAPACPIGPGNLIPSSPSCDESISS